MFDGVLKVGENGPVWLADVSDSEVLRRIKDVGN